MYFSIYCSIKTKNDKIPFCGKVNLQISYFHPQKVLGATLEQNLSYDKIEVEFVICS